MPRKTRRGRPEFENPADRHDRTIGVRLRAEEFAALASLANTRDVRVSNVVRDAIALYLQRGKPRKGSR